MYILYVLPHCSTGGMPQYVLKMIEELCEEHNITVLEYNNYSNDYVVQRNAIKNIVEFIQINGDKNAFLNVVSGGFDIIHFQEVPETFLTIGVLDEIYRQDRKYSIVVTTHSSYTDPRTIKYTADRYVLVSNWSKKVFDDYYRGDIECLVWEYPTKSVKYDKESAKRLAGFDLEYKHVLHVGLFTPGKNQKELIEIASLCIRDKIKFHFVGNQASNFYDYWGPLMSEFPSNCIWHGEREDVDMFYKAADVFYFPSLFELNPIALKEALSFNLPILTKKLHTYEDYYDGKATYITDDVSNNKIILFDVLGVSPVPLPKIQAIHLLTDINHDREKKSIDYVSKLKEYGIDYVQVINTPYEALPPKEFCNRPDSVGEKSEYLGDGLGILTGRHYGCFLAHTEAIKNIDVDNYDFTLIFEADASIEFSHDDFLNMVYRACDLCVGQQSPFVSLSNNPSGSKNKFNHDFWLTSPNQDLAHCYLIPNYEKNWYLRRIEDTPWDGFDVWLNNVFHRFPRKRFTTTKVWSDQIAGMSLIDGVVKWEKPLHYDYIEIGTSDFDTLVESYQEQTIGLSIEPIKTYLDRLPNKQGNKKINAAITDNDCQLSVYYVKPDDIEKHNLPDWIKGCNSVGCHHPSVVRELMERELMDIYTCDTINGISFQSLIKEANIGSVDYLKVDTEGHDFIILRSMLNTPLRPQKIRFEANTLSSEEDILKIIADMSEHGYKLVQRTSDDVVMRLEVDDDNKPYTAPILIISSGRRWKYFEKTINLLVQKNPDIAQIVKNVWVLDDRSTAGDRVNMELLMSAHFGDRWGMVCFNGSQPFDFVDKFRMIKSLIEPTDVVFLLEDDWECHDYLHLPYHINKLQSSDWTQIAFADPFDIQTHETQNKTRIDQTYWKNPFPDSFKHPVRWDGDMCWWFMGSINNYTNNPSLIKGEVFFRGQYIKHKNFEASFSEQIKGNQVFTQEALFRHFGDDSLINKL